MTLFLLKFRFLFLKRRDLKKKEAPWPIKSISGYSPATASAGGFLAAFLIATRKMALSLCFAFLKPISSTVRRSRGEDDSFEECD